MLLKLAEQVADCHRRARESRLRAEAATDPALKQDYLNLERRWMMLAESYQLSQRVSDFQNEARKRIAVFRPPTPPDPALPRVMCPRCGKRMKLTQIKPDLEPNRADTNTFECKCGEKLQLKLKRRD